MLAFVRFVGTAICASVAAPGNSVVGDGELYRCGRQMSVRSYDLTRGMPSCQSGRMLLKLVIGASKTVIANPSAAEVSSAVRDEAA
jgi:hypothetical protein